MDSVLVVGSVAYDSVETPVKKVENSLGGSAIYFSAAASLFAPVKVVGVVGDDFNWDDIAFLKEKNVDFEGMQQVPGKTFRWGGRYKQDMNYRETLYTDLNVFETFDPHIPDDYKKTPFLFLANIQPELQQCVLAQMERPRFTMLDTMNFWIEGRYEALIETIKRVDGIVINEEEALDLVHETNLIRAMRKITALGPRVIIVKKGEHGAILSVNNSYFFAPAYPIENVVDPTGAGDSFAGGFMGYLTQQGDVTEVNLRKAVIYGSAVASFCVEGFSVSRLRELSRNELDERVAAFKKLVEF
ncbi:MAG: sugar kinase [Calditrichaeota bacterium]|nr:sugar kinase [Calditrichota bacterium]